MTKKEWKKRRMGRLAVKKWLKKVATLCRQYEPRLRGRGFRMELTPKGRAGMFRTELRMLCWDRKGNFYDRPWEEKARGTTPSEGTASSRLSGIAKG